MAIEMADGLREAEQGLLQSDAQVHVEVLAIWGSGPVGRRGGGVVSGSVGRWLVACWVLRVFNESSSELLINHSENI